MLKDKNQTIAISSHQYNIQYIHIDINVAMILPVSFKPAVNKMANMLNDNFTLRLLQGTL